MFIERSRAQGKSFAQSTKSFAQSKSKRLQAKFGDLHTRRQALIAISGPVAKVTSGLAGIMRRRLMPALKSSIATHAQNTFAVCQKAKSQAKAAIKKAMGNGSASGESDDQRYAQ